MSSFLPGMERRKDMNKTYILCKYVDVNAQESWRTTSGQTRCRRAGGKVAATTRSEKKIGETGE